MVKQDRSLTEAQGCTLGKNLHLVFASMLDDGDCLILDSDGPDHRSLQYLYAPHYGPYVLTTDGKVQDVNYHYATHHGLKVAHPETERVT